MVWKWVNAFFVCNVMVHVYISSLSEFVQNVYIYGICHGVMLKVIETLQRDFDLERAFD